MDSSSLVEQGIAAYRAGNKEEAVRLLGQALREDRQNEEAWLYLGAALEDPARKRQAFQQVLQINPDNEKAQNALARLDASAPSGAAGAAHPSTPPAAAAPKRKVSTPSGEGFALPFQVDGQPATVTVPYLIENGRARVEQAIQIYLKQDFEQIIAAGQTATMWDVVFTAGVGVVAVGAAELIGRWIGWPLMGFAGGLGGLIYPIIAAIISMAATGAGFAAAAYASRWYLQNQNINVPAPQHAMYVALTFLPLVLVNALTSFVSHALGFLVCFVIPLLALVGLAAFIYGIYLLWKAFERLYGSENNRGIITAAIAAGGWIIASIVVGIVGNIIGGLFSAIFRYRYV